MLWEVQDVLATSPRFEVLPGIDVVDPSSWDQGLTPSLATDLCAERGCDAVLALEAFEDALDHDRLGAVVGLGQEDLRHAAQGQATENGVAAQRLCRHVFYSTGLASIFQIRRQ